MDIKNIVKEVKDNIDIEEVKEKAIEVLKSDEAKDVIEDIKKKFDKK